MADKVVFDPQKLQSGSLVDCQEQQLLELAKSCAVLPRRNAAKTASRAVFARGIYMSPRMGESRSAKPVRPVRTAGRSLSLNIWLPRCSGTARRARRRMFMP